MYTYEDDGEPHSDEIEEVEVPTYCNWCGSTSWFELAEGGMWLQVCCDCGKRHYAED